MAYSQKDVTNGIKKKKKSIDPDEIMAEIDGAFEEPSEKVEDSKEEEIKEDSKEEEKEEIKEEVKEEPIRKRNVDKETHLHVKENLDEEFIFPKKKEVPKRPSVILPILAFIAIVCGVLSFLSILIDSTQSILTIVSSAVITLFAILYLVVCVKSRSKNPLPMIISAVLLIGYFLLNVNIGGSLTTVSTSKVQNFSGKTLTDAVKWANKNKVKITQEYEFSDMVPEYEIISQSVKPGTSLKDVEEIVVSVSEGPNPYKEIVVPSMLTWDSERVINYVLSNHLSNVIIEFVDSDQVKDTVIEQSKSGNLKRNDELKLTFSYGDEGNSNEVSLIDFTNKTKFEIEFYMKQHKLNYNFEYDFSDTIKKGYGVKQSIAGGTKVGVNGDKIQVTISKGPKIEIPELSGMSISELTEWAIDNRLKLEFVDKYDDTVKYGKVISIDKKKGDVVEQGTLLKVTLSLGGLKMPKFKNADSFYAWADKYGIKYETRHEFSDSVEAGQVISFSYKTGATIKNDEAIVVTISDGAKVGVPNLKGLTKNEAIKKLNAANLNYNFVYKNNSAKKDTVLSQSISAGSEVTSGTTVTVTLSNGNSGSSGGNSGGNSGSNTGGGGNTNPSPSPEPSPSPSPDPPAPVCNSCSVGRLTRVWSENPDGGYSVIASALIREIERQCPGINVQVRPDDTTGEVSGTFISGFDGGSVDNNGNALTSCSTVYIYLAK